MSAINLVEVYKIVNSFFNYFEGNFLIAKNSSFEIWGLPSVARSIRSKQGHVIINEAAFDSRGNGQMIAELAAQEYPGSIFQVMLSRKWYAENFPKLKDAFEDGKTNIPDDPAIKDDYKVVGLTQGVPLITDRTGGRHNKRHEDSYIAKVMALFAYNELEGGAYQPYVYEPVKIKNDFIGKAHDV